MKRKTYYIILAIALLAVFIIELLKFPSFRPLNGPKLIVALFILMYESAYAQKPVRIINFCVMPFIFFGWSFIIMHWPFGHLIFLGSLFIMLTLILVNTFRKRERKAIDLLILAFPVCHVMLACCIVFRLGWATYYISGIEGLLAGLIAGVLLYTLKEPFKKQG